MTSTRPLVFAALTVLCAPLAPPSLSAQPIASVPEAAWKILPHRAVYDMSLDPRASGTQINNVYGRLVFEINGTPCEGFTQNMRMVTRVNNSRGGGQTTDVRTSSWEEANGQTFRFSSSLYVNSKKSEGSQGNAKRKGAGDGVSVTLKEPKPGEIAFNGRVMFPAQHSIAVLDAALAGKSNVTTQLYDGSEGGKKIYNTVTFIGRGRSAGTISGASELAALSGKTAWPVTIAFYEPTKDDAPSQSDETPVYELGFQYFENGVSGNLSIAYRTFTLKGKLVKLETIPVSECKR